MTQSSHVPTRMRALVQKGAEDVRVEELGVPEPGPGEILLRVRANGLCGSDVHFWRHAVYGAGVVLGHEIAGEVAAVGDGVGDRPLGQLGALHSAAPCGTCDRCRDGLGYYCQHGVGLGTGRGNGGFAEYVVAPAANFLPVPPGTDPAAAAFSEPLANGLRCLDHPEVRNAKTALIIGAGPIGLSCLVAARRAGVERVVVVEGRPRRSRAATALGASRVLHPVEDDLRSEIRRELGFGADLVVEAVGLPETMQSAFRWARPRGTVFLMGVCFGDVEMRPMRWMLKELTLRSSLGCNRDDQLAAVEMLRRGEIDPLPLITRRVSIDEVPETLAALATGADEIKVVLEHGH